MRSTAVVHVLALSSRRGMRWLLDQLHRESKGLVEITWVRLDDLAAVEAASKLDQVELVLVDVEPHPDAAVHLCQELRRRKSMLPIVLHVPSGRPLAPAETAALFECGIGGLVDMELGPDHYARELVRIAKGEIRLVAHLPEGFPAGQRRAGAAAVQFSGLQMRLLELVALGLRDKEIGGLLYLSESAIKHRVDDLRRATDTRNRTELAAWAASRGYYRTRLAG